MISADLKHLVKPKYFIASITLLVLVLLGMTLFDLFSSKDLTTSGILDNSPENLEFRLKREEYKFREEILQQCDSIISDSSFFRLDSAINSVEYARMIKRDILVNHLKTSFSEKEYSVELNTLSDFSFFVKYSRLVVLFEIDFSQLSTIVDASKPPQISEEIIKYGDYIRTTTSFKKKVDIQNIVIAIFVLIVISVLWFFGYRIGGKHDDESLESKKEKLSSNKKKLEEIKETLSEDGVEPELVERISGLLEKVEEQLEAYEDENIVKSILFEEVVKAETRSNELYNRSTLMLILGLVTATVGVVVFYITLPNYIDQAPSQYLPSTIRPSLILLFIQSIAFYLLRQYRSLILDYKHFYQEYTKTARIFSVYQILQRENPSDEMKRFAETVLQGVELQQLGNSKKENESKDNQIVVETLKSLVSKLKV